MAGKPREEFEAVDEIETIRTLETAIYQGREVHRFDAVGKRLGGTQHTIGW